MADYNKILSQFTQFNYNQSSEMQQQQIDRVLDQITYSNTGISEFDRQVTEQLWEHTEKRSQNTVILRNYIHTIIEAQKILKEQINSIEDELRTTKDQNRKQQMMGDMYSFSQDYRILTAPFKIDQLRDTAMLQQSHLNHNQSNLSRMRQSSGIWDQSPSRSEKSWSLKITFIVTVILVLVELIIMFHKHHFYTLLCYALVLSIFFLNFFDKTYIKFVMVNVLLSVVLDLVWLVAMAQHFWNPYPETQHSSIQGGFLKLIIFMVIIVMAGKVTIFAIEILLLLLLFRYRDNSEQLRKTVELFKLVFHLDAKPHRNPITSILTGTRY